MTRRFQRRDEDFVCGHCQTSVSGSGYTNHCPACLWSRHVDVNPGDRESTCGALMEPTGCELKAGKMRIHHRCTGCAHTFVCRTVAADDQDAIIALSVGDADRLFRGL